MHDDVGLTQLALSCKCDVCVQCYASHAFGAAKFTAVAYSILNSNMTNHNKNVRLRVDVSNIK